MKRLPAEWEPQDAVMLTWPHQDSDWRPWLAAAEDCFAELAYHIGRRQRVLIVCRDPAQRDRIRALLQQRHVPAAATHFAIADSNDSWARDHGPITVYEDGRPVLLDWIFNGWGGKYPAAADNHITATARRQGLFGNTLLRPVDIVLEGGSLDSDGCGTLLTTAQCLLSPMRNPALDRNGIERQLQRQLGARRVLWLEHGWLEGDDTDGHIDMLARFCSPDTIAFSSCDDSNDVHRVPLQRMHEELRRLRRSDGRPYRLIPLPIPRPLYHAGQRLPASYANFLVINDAVLMPCYGDPMDAVARQRLGWCFPGRSIIAIDARPLIRQYGSLHCVTMQLPAGILQPSARRTSA